MGMCGARAPQERDFVPNPLANAREGGHSTCVMWRPLGQKSQQSVPCSVRERAWCLSPPTPQIPGQELWRGQRALMWLTAAR